MFQKLLQTAASRMKHANKSKTISATIIAGCNFAAYFEQVNAGWESCFQVLHFYNEIHDMSLK